MLTVRTRGETTRYLAIAFGAAVVSAVGTKFGMKLGEWAVERIRRACSDEAPRPPTGPPG